MASGHGYGPYTNGCRCDVCRQAKADYQREKRHAAAAVSEGMPRLDRTDLLGTADGRFVAPFVTHGTAHAYKDNGCRCLPCTDAATEKRAREYEAARDRGAS